MITDVIRIPALKPVQISPDTWSGTILKADHFGNLITNFAIAEFGDGQAIAAQFATISIAKQMRKLGITLILAGIGRPST